MKRKLFRSKNWESNVRDVTIEPCPAHEDPMGYRAIFLQGPDDMPSAGEVFSIGASHLGKRAENLQKAGYVAPMTERAIAMVNAMIGEHSRKMAAC